MQNWEKAAEDLVRFGITDATSELIQNPDWCVSKLGDLGYSISLTYMGVEGYLAKVREIGKISTDDPFIKESVESIHNSPYRGIWGYQLLGGDDIYRVDVRGDHSSPLLSSIQEAAYIALWNVARIRKECKH